MHLNPYTIKTTNKKWIVNLSSTNVPTDILDFLSLGPKFALPVDGNSLDVKRFLMQIENTLTRCPDIDTNVVRAQVTNIVTNFSKNISSPRDTWLANMLSRSRWFLKSNPDLLITRADKGAVTVLLDKDEYLDKATELLNDVNSYKRINTNPLTTTQSKLNKLLKNLNTEKHINDEELKRLTIRNSTLCKAYFLPKIHKNGTPLRPIISATGSATYGLSNFIANILSVSLLNDTDYNVSDSFDFVDKIRDVAVPTGYSLVSLDVVSLFTNVPLDLVLDILRTKWDRIKVNCNFTLEAFIDTVEFLFKNIYFSFNEIIYLQLFGTPMGSPMSPILAQIVMDFALDSIIPNLNFMPPFIYKFVDDIVTCIPSDSMDDTLAIFNQFNRHIQFTIELEHEGCIPFLDCRVLRLGDGSVVVDWYTKPTYSGRYINFYSSHSFAHKVNTLAAVKNRILKICSPQFQHSALRRLSQVFCNNGFPSRLIQ